LSLVCAVIYASTKDRIDSTTTVHVFVDIDWLPQASKAFSCGTSYRTEGLKPPPQILAWPSPPQFLYQYHTLVTQCQHWTLCRKTSGDARHQNRINAQEQFRGLCLCHYH